MFLLSCKKHVLYGTVIVKALWNVPYSSLDFICLLDDQIRDNHQLVLNREQLMLDTGKAIEKKRTKNRQIPIHPIFSFQWVNAVPTTPTLAPPPQCPASGPGWRGARGWTPPRSGWRWRSLCPKRGGRSKAVRWPNT